MGSGIIIPVHHSMSSTCFLWTLQNLSFPRRNFIALFFGQRTVLVGYPEHGLLLLI
jgi:hypothetical protein